MTAKGTPLPVKSNQLYGNWRIIVTIRIHRISFLANSVGPCIGAPLLQVLRYLSNWQLEQKAQLRGQILGRTILQGGCDHA